MIQGATSDEEMDVRVIAEISGPGVEHAHQTESATDKARVLGQLQQGLGGRAEEQVVDRLLLRASQGPQLGGQGEGDQEVRDGQQQLLLLVQPLIGLLVAALGTVPVLAGVIAVTLLLTLVTEIDLPAASGGAALFDVEHGPEMGRQHAAAELLPVLWAMPPENIGHFQHERTQRSAMSWSMVAAPRCSAFAVRCV